MRFEPLEVDGAVLVRPTPRGDDRGWFARIFCAEEFAANRLETAVVQVNLVMTVQAGTVRGLHYQLPPAAEAKLVRSVHGTVFDVVVDNRPWSPTFRRWVAVELSGEDAVALYVPPGCAHGYQALTDGARALYQTSAPYSPEHERGINHADSELAISWPLPPRNVSEKDRALPTLQAAELPDPPA